MNTLDLLFFAGRPFGPLYSAIQTVRAGMYRKSILKSFAVDVPVISVGNLTMGGTGKTPMVLMLAQTLYDQGFRPAIVSRGYGGTARNNVNIVSDGSAILLPPLEAGDEPYLLASMLPSTPVLTGKKRILPCRHAVDHFDVDIIILDDGFQHLSMRRDINIVLFNATTLAGNSRVFPGGDLREPVNALHRADIFVLTGITSENNTRAHSFQQLLEQRFPDTPVCLSRYSEPFVFDLQNKKVDRESLPLPVLAFSGIANPQRFYDSLENCDIHPVERICLKDHALYTNKEKAQINRAIEGSGAVAAITTLKDRVKLNENDFSVPLYYLSHETSISEPLTDFILSRLETFLHRESS
ncbi:tetraacyldisaccharide 4'-kinase [Desulfopila sp. IMCC35008]|uniref:tetraacyldisaccharide 4'-kinase n=1 Tax=Desulfopila sp. IMCC35008 TaxID=2653858 RepID=UPI0013D11274|nr:tetraacyldisaccharide 4'-kinase [Desulfopila sp. IMCC35008]